MNFGPDIFVFSIIDRCFLKTRSTIPFGWLIKLGRRIFSDINGTIPDDVVVTDNVVNLVISISLSLSLLLSLSLSLSLLLSLLLLLSLSLSLSVAVAFPVASEICLKTRNTIPFGWLINFGRTTLFLLFLPGGALSGY